MPEPVRVRIPHHLGRVEAKRRIAEGLVKIQATVGQLASSIQKNWTGDQLDFSAVALGQALSGRILVGDTAVDIELDLPGMLGSFASIIKGQIKDRGFRLLGRE